MKWFTDVETGRSPHLISYKNRILFLGSCFSQEIGGRMQQYGFNTLVNPFGVLYNPQSVAHSINRLVKNEPVNTNDIVRDGSVFKSIYHSGEYSSMSMDALIENLNISISDASAFLNAADTVALTFGTTWIFKRRDDGRVVSNCHKQPAGGFERLALTTEEIVGMLAPLIELMPQKRWFLSVSPVRHLKDGAKENMLSKSSLILALNELEKRYSNVVYFPSFEIVMDELRDYRFYGPDLIHLTEEATNYIWERFAKFALEKEAEELLKDYKRLYELKRHRPLFPESSEYKGLLKRIDELDAFLKKKRS